jgi:Alpha/beta hydrolase of unknown function (DUF900)
MGSGLLRHCFLAALALTAAIGIGDPANAQQADEQSKTDFRGVPYLTLRNHTGERTPDSYYGEERDVVRSGWCEIDQTELPFMGSVADKVSFRIPEEFLRVSEIREVPHEIMWVKFRDQLGPNAPNLYVHGYYIDFEKGCRRATTFQENAGLSGRLLWFSWPSDGSLINYAHDEADLYWSVPDIAEAIIEMENYLDGRPMNLIGHSLGARGLLFALVDISNRDVDLHIGNVVLLASDVDFGIFQKYLPRVRGLAERITIYTSDSDRPLAISQQFHGYPRLGETGNDVASLGDVEVIDVSDLPVMSPTGHLYHIYNPEVGADLNQLLDQHMPASERQNLRKVGENLWRLQSGTGE